MGLALVGSILPMSEVSAAAPRPASELIKAWSTKYTIKTYQEADARIHYQGAWIRAGHRSYFGNFAMSSTQRNARAEITFVGNAIAWVGPVGPTRGKAKVYLDGRLVKTVSTNGPTFRARTVLFETSVRSGTHTLTIVVQGTTGHPTLAIDEFVVRGTKKTPVAHTPAPKPAATPKPTPKPTPKAAPASTGTVSVPSTIDSSGSSDASAAFSSWLKTVPDGSTIAFKAGGTYRFDRAIRISNRHNIVLDGKGATVRISGCAVEDSAFLLDETPSSGVVIRNFTIAGDNSGAGTTSAFVAGCESQMGVAVYGARNTEIANVTITGVHAECVYIDAAGAPRGTGPWADGVNFHDSTCRLNGRMGVVIAAGTNVTVQRVTFDRLAISAIDIEPYMSNGGATNVSFVDNTIHGYAASPTYTGWVLETSAYGMTTTKIRDITVARNRITLGGTHSANTPNSAGLTIKARTSRSGNISIVDNVSTASGSGPTMYFEHVDGVTVSGNTQALTSGSLVWMSDSTTR